MSQRSRDDSDEPDVGRVLRRGLKSAVARWALAKRRGLRPVPGPQPHDEATHPWNGRPGFAEDYTFVAVQPDMGLVVRLEHLPARDCHRVWVTALRSDGVWALPGGETVLRTTSADRWRAAGLHLDCVTPLQRWTFRFGGTLLRQGAGGEPSRGLRVVEGGDGAAVRARFDLTFDAEHPPFVPGRDDDPELVARRLGEARWDTTLLRAARRTRRRGYVQLGRVHGTVAIGERLSPVRAWTLRQHHWGDRVGPGPELALQCLWACDDARRGWLHHLRLPHLTLEGGFGVHRDRLAALRALGWTQEARPTGVPAHLSLSVDDGEGARIVEARVVSSLSWVSDGREAIDLGLLEVTGPSPGWGIWARLTGLEDP